MSMALQSGASSTMIQPPTSEFSDSILRTQSATAATDSNKNNAPMASTAPAKVAAPISVAGL